MQLRFSFSSQFIRFLRSIVAVLMFIALVMGRGAQAISLATPLAEPLLLSEQATVSVVTCAPGNEKLHQAFGHSAFRVHDPEKEIDWVYNYGAYRFDRANFHWNFVKGYLIYELHKQDYQGFRSLYVRDNRSITEQILAIDRSQRQRLFEFLEHNSLAENREYLYDYFGNNCATKLRDVVQQVFGDAVYFDNSYLTSAISSNTTIRALLDDYLQARHPWGDFFIDLALGSTIDKTLTPKQYLFLPEYVHKAFANARIKTATASRPLVMSNVMTFEGSAELPDLSLFSPTTICWLLLVSVLLMTWWELTASTYFKAIDIGLFTLLGLLGCFLLFLWLGTNHVSAYNFNLLWAIPFHLPLALVFAFSKVPGLVQPYFFSTGILMLLVLSSWPWLPQSLHLALIPALLIISLRAFMTHRAAGSATRSVASIANCD